MKRAPRVAALEALLARIQANAAAGRPARATDDALLADDGEPRAVAGERDRDPDAGGDEVGRPPVEPADLGAFASLLERELRDPSPSTPPPPSTATTPRPLATVRRSSQPPPPVTITPSAPPPPASGGVPSSPFSLADAAPHASSSRASAGDPDPQPDSQLARAIVAAAAGAPAVDPRDLLREAGSDLRERRSSDAPARAAPDAPGAPGSRRLDGGAAHPGRDGRVPPAGPAPFPVPTDVHPAPSSPPVRRSWRATMLVAAALAIPAAGWLASRLVDGGAAVGPIASPSVAAPASPGPATHDASAATSAPAAPPTALAVAASAQVDGGARPVADDPPPAIARPYDHGLLRIDAAPTADVYLQGVRAGESGRWLEVPCGPRNARLARPGEPLPGHSFPMWLGVGRTVEVPCGAAHRLRWRWE